MKDFLIHRDSNNESVFNGDLLIRLCLSY